MGIPITCWNTLFPSLKKQLLNRNFTFLLRVTYVKVEKSKHEIEIAVADLFILSNPFRTRLLKNLACLSVMSFSVVVFIIS